MAFLAIQFPQNLPIYFQSVPCAVNIKSYFPNISNCFLFFLAPIVLLPTLSLNLMVVTLRSTKLIVLDGKVTVYNSQNRLGYAVLMENPQTPVAQNNKIYFSLILRVHWGSPSKLYSL